MIGSKSFYAVLLLGILIRSGVCSAEIDLSKLEEVKVIRMDGTFEMLDNRTLQPRTIGVPGNGILPCEDTSRNVEPGFGLTTNRMEKCVVSVYPKASVLALINDIKKNQVAQMKAFENEVRAMYKQILQDPEFRKAMQDEVTKMADLTIRANQP